MTQNYLIKTQILNYLRKQWLNSYVRKLWRMTYVRSGVQRAPVSLPVRLLEKIKATWFIEKYHSALTESMNEEVGKTRRAGFYDFLQDESYLQVPTDPRVWIYNVSRMSFSVDHPLFPKVNIPGNDTDKPYVMYTSLPSVMMIPQQRFNDKGEICLSRIPMLGLRVAMDIINPDNLGFDQAVKITAYTSLGRDLGAKGVFWSLHNPPLPEEVEAATKRMEASYTNLLEKAQILYMNAVVNEATILRYIKGNPDASLEDALRETRKAKVSLEITPEHHAAAEYFKVNPEWHSVSHS